MRRREFIQLIGVATGWPITAGAQQGSKPVRIGMLVPGGLDSTDQRALLETLRQALRERGLVEGGNITIELRTADGQIERLPALARELVSLDVDVMLAGATAAAQAAKQATVTIPIIAMAMGDPVRDGLVASLAHPGGNVTGTTFLGPELVPKRMALLKELLPFASRVAVLWHPGAYGEATTNDMLNEARDAAAKLGQQLQFIEASGQEEFDRAFATIVAGGAEALLQFPSPVFFNLRRRFVELATLHRLPTMFNAREFVELGGLIGYGTSIVELTRRTAVYVDKVLKGAKPSELPVEQPTRFELLINLKTAKMLGLTVPPALLARADVVIE